LKTPSLEQIAGLVRSLDAPEEKLMVELCAFAGLRWRSVPHLLRGNFDLGCLADEMPYCRPMQVYVPYRAAHADGDQWIVLRFFTFLCLEGCELLRRVLDVYAATGSPPGGRLFRGRGAADRVRGRLEASGLTGAELRRYFKRSLTDARTAGKTALSRSQIAFLAGNVRREHDYDHDRMRWDKDALFMRDAYAKLEAECFTTANVRRTDDGPIGDITFPL